MPTSTQAPKFVWRAGTTGQARAQHAVRILTFDNGLGQQVLAGMAECGYTPPAWRERRAGGYCGRCSNVVPVPGEDLSRRSCAQTVVAES